MDFQFDIVIGPFLAVFIICWIIFCLLLILKPYSWIEMQNRYSRPYGFEWKITDEKKFVTVHKRAGILLLIFGLLFALILIARLIVI
ncbi:MAG: hypothetical protein FJZ10_06695 [Candidatus Omnitrophica bacterium]|nr:hypothetical protein [Candidatus Omnitrophota bacterium]